MHSFQTDDRSAGDPLRNLGRMVDDCVEIVDADGRWVMTMPFEAALTLHQSTKDRSPHIAQ